jgi:hypothetical protein
MKRKILIAGLSILIVLVIQNFSTSAQENTSDCKVLIKGISEHYQGECKNGLAEGNGIAKGADIYIGSFRKGFPDGKGVYKYKDGPTYTGYWKKGLKDGEGELRYMINGKDSVITGVWKADIYTGKQNKADDYKITNQNNIDYYSIKRSDQDRNLIEVSFERVMLKYIPRDLEFTFSSGHLTKDGWTLTLRDFTCPVYCYIHYTLKKQDEAIICNFDFEILTPGKYTVLVTNN